MTTAAMVQSSYLPWKGYFDQILQADVFVFYDDVQFTKEDWRSRNRIKTKDGLKWLTVPVGSRIDRRICDVTIAAHGWQRKHWSAIAHAYARAPHFETYRPLLEPLYLGRNWTNLSELNQTLVKMVARECFGATAAFRDSREFDIPVGLSRERRWVEVLERLGADRFVIGPKARDYLDEKRRDWIAARGIELVWLDYAGYPEYPQLFPPFEHRVSAIDLVFNTGPEAARYLRRGAD